MGIPLHVTYLITQVMSKMLKKTSRSITSINIFRNQTSRADLKITFAK